jgi:hypothetical protein
MICCGCGAEHFGSGKRVAAGFGLWISPVAEDVVITPARHVALLPANAPPQATWWEVVLLGLNGASALTALFPPLFGVGCSNLRTHLFVCSFLFYFFIN